MKDAIDVCLDKECKYRRTILVSHIITLQESGEWTQIILSNKEQIAVFHSKQEILHMMGAKV